MDKKPPPGSAAAQTWNWLPEQMPGVARLMREKRQQHGNEWVNECWRQGVRLGQPGWFFAAEGSLMVGTLGDVPEVLAVVANKVTRTQAVLYIRTPTPQGATDGPR
jgi:hypothetical protein